MMSSSFRGFFLLIIVKNIQNVKNIHCLRLWCLYISRPFYYFTYFQISLKEGFKSKTKEKFQSHRKSNVKDRVQSKKFSSTSANSQGDAKPAAAPPAAAAPALPPVSRPFSWSFVDMVWGNEGVSERQRPWVDSAQRTKTSVKFSDFQREI